MDTHDIDVTSFDAGHKDFIIISLPKDNKRIIVNLIGEKEAHYQDYINHQWVTNKKYAIEQIDEKTFVHGI